MGLLKYLGGLAVIIVGLGLIFFGFIIFFVSPFFAVFGGNIIVVWGIAFILIIAGIFVIATGRYYAKKA